MSKSLTTLFRRQMSWKIYTKTGDKGTSALYTGERINKDNQIFYSLGAIDELNAHLGLAREHLKSMTIKENEQLIEEGIAQIEEIQSCLINVGSAVATPRSSDQEKKVNHTAFDEEQVTNLEKWIDKMDESLPTLTNFILPSGGYAASQLHVARTVCRRAERDLVPLYTDEQIDKPTYTYINRLSDYLFTLARTCAMCEGQEETIHKMKKKAKKTEDTML